MTSKLLIDSDNELELDAAALPLQNEVLWIVDWLALLGSPVYAGTSIPSGHGRSVIVVPGFLGSFSRLRPLTSWLRRIGYRVHHPGFERTIECPDVLLQRLDRQIALVAAADGRPVTLIGHSLGGSLARAAAVHAPGFVDQVITLGSPLRSVTVHPAVRGAARLLARMAPSRHAAHTGHDHGPTCARELSEALAAPFPRAVRRVAIYTKDDGVVAWGTCVEGDNGVDVEVTGTHLGLVVNPAVYEAIARALAETVRDTMASGVNTLGSPWVAAYSAGGRAHGSGHAAVA
jgi:pimeloyl-ACP methyl ester carboxylesterase